MTGNRELSAAAREESVRRKTAGSGKRFERARKTLAGGVSTSLRRTARPYPLYFDRGAGAEVFDVDGNRYLDYGLAWGPLIAGHSHPAIIEAIESWLHRGTTFGAQHDLEYEVAETVARIVPCAEQVAFSNSGTEIVQLALRLARAVTGRAKHIKFEGHYHGWDDSVLVSYKPSLEQIRSANGGPVPVGAGQRPHNDVLIAQWNDRASIEHLFATEAGSIACVICEPLLCNNGCIEPESGFLQFLRDITGRHGSLLIFDEVITGFRLALAGAQKHYGVTPDLAVFAKAIGGGTPLSALAGPSAFMEQIANGRVVHAGTLNGNPLSLAAAKATLQILEADNGAVYPRLWSLGDSLRTGIEQRLRSEGHSVVTSGAGPVFQVSFMDTPARTYRDMHRANQAAYSDFALALLDEGVSVLPDGRWYLSAAHSEAHIAETLEAVERAAATLAA